MLKNCFFKKTFLLILFIIFGLLITDYIFAATTQIRIQIIGVCGNGVVESGEQCDDGGSNGACPATCSTSCTTNSCGGGGGGGGGGGTYIATKVILQGRAYPGSSINILKDAKLAAIIKADSQADFNYELSDITPGVYTFGIWAEDKKGVKSLTFSFTTNIISGMATTISGIFLPPTIEIDKTFVQRGEILNFLGQTAPQSEVSIIVNSPGEIIKKTKAETDGTWFYGFDTASLEEGSHGTRANATSLEGLSSTFSQTLTFKVGKEMAGVIIKTDINGDKKVNLFDFSILLYNWGIPKNPAVDLNSDGKVDLRDFSIMLYYWTG